MNRSNFHNVGYFIRMPLIALLLTLGCGDPPITKPEVTGSIYIDSEIATDANSTTKPETISVILDGDSLGQFPNQSVIDNILTGQHLLDVFSVENVTVYRSRSRQIVVAFNSTSEVTIPLTDIGVLTINGFIEGVPADSLRIIIDGIDRGKSSCPIPVLSISSGTHDIKVMTDLDTLMYEGYANDLKIIAAETTEVNFELVTVSPFVNNKAPDITSLDGDGNIRSLFNHWGEVIFLYFFRST